MLGLPTGTVTFLFTDIEGSTTLLQRLGDRRYAEILAEHQRLLRDAFAKGGGHEVDTQGDAFLVAFSRARDAVASAVTSQLALLNHSWPDGASLKVRMGLHTGEPISTSGRYVGLDVHRVARICAAGHGGQILLSQTTRELVATDPHRGISLRDLGEHRFKDLATPQRLFQVVTVDLPADFPALKSLNPLSNNLPRQLTSFIGREQDIVEVKRELSTAYLVTLTGTGGAGKTRLALQVAAGLLAQFPDGVWLAQLAPLSDPTLVPKALASALGIPEQPGRPLTETVVAYLRPRAALLLLDNCEHLLQACASLANALLQRCPNVRVLATSREALGITGELIYRVPSLSLPDLTRLPPLEALTQYEAVRLFVDRAAVSKPGFRVTGSNAMAVAQVTTRLDGIPLAIELAAARVKALPVDVIVARLDDQFRLLRGGSRTALPRHRTLRATLDWSYDLLSDPERMLLRRLSVFAGGFTLEAAEQICAGDGIDASDILDVLTRLIDKSLVVFEEREERARYSLLESVRQYGRETLLETHDDAAVRERHRDHFLRLAEDAEPHFWGAEEGEWLDRLEGEHDNLRAAIAWSAQSGDAPAVLRLIGAVGWFWYRHGHWSEGRDWARKALEGATDVGPAARLGALQTSETLATAQGDAEEGVRLGEEALQLATQLGSKREIGRSLYALGHAITVFMGDWQRADTMLTESFILSSEAGDTVTAGSALRFRGIVALRNKDYAQARDLLTKSAALYRRIGYKRGIALAAQTLGYVSYQEQNYVEAGALLQESETLYQGIHDEESRALGLVALGNVARKSGDLTKAARCLKDALIIQQKMGAKGRIALTLESIAALSAAHGFMPRAAHLFGAATSHKPEGAGVSLRPPDRNELIKSVRAGLGDAAFADAWAVGEDMTLEQAIEYALSEVDV